MRKNFFISNRVVDLLNKLNEEKSSKCSNNKKFRDPRGRYRIRPKIYKSPFHIHKQVISNSNIYEYICHTQKHNPHDVAVSVTDSHTHGLPGIKPK